MQVINTLMLLASFTTLSVAIHLSSKDIRNIRRFIGHVMQCRGVPGMSVAIVETNRTVLTEGFGLANVEKGVQVTENTLFCIASLTKAFTATLLGNILNKHG